MPRRSSLLSGRVGSRVRSTCCCAPAVDRVYIDAAGALFERFRELVAIVETVERVPCRLVVTDVVGIASKRMCRRAGGDGLARHLLYYRCRPFQRGILDDNVGRTVARSFGRAAAAIRLDRTDDAQPCISLLVIDSLSGDSQRGGKEETPGDASVFEALVRHYLNCGSGEGSSGLRRGLGERIS